jgi:phosphoribosylaminoimidazolecarboxamide formyltransferase/IMP cyclohydrolase
MTVVNLYPFKETISKKNITPENARGNIDIGGPCMIRASAKNFLRVAAVVNPLDYEAVADELEKNRGKITLKLRYRLAQKAFKHTADYDCMISEYLNNTLYSDVKTCYNF